MTDKKKENQEQDEIEENEDDQEKNIIGNFASRTIASVKNTITGVIIPKNNVLSLRVSDEDNMKLTMLIDAGLFKSKSECASFFVSDGLKQQKALFEKISEKTAEIKKLKDQLKSFLVIK